MIYNNINKIGWTFQIVSPNLESFKDGKQFLVMCVIIQLHYSESTRVKSNWINFIIIINNENFAKPKKDWISLTFLGSSQSWIIFTLLSDIIRLEED